LDGHRHGTFFAIFSPDGKKIATTSPDCTARIWTLPLDKPPVSPLDLPPVEDEDDNAYRERILAEERAKELALIEAERKIIPLVEEPDKLIPLDEQDRIWITPDRKSVVLIGRVVFREGFLELLACRVASKEHESILAIRVKPMLIHAALLATNARQGKPMQTVPTFAPATGDKINITFRWKDNTGKQHECPAQDWVWDMASSKENAKKPMTTHWVFSGSKEYQDDEGKRRYLAEETGELFGLSNFFGSILDVPIESSADNTKLQFGCFTERIPPLDTPVTIILSPAR
jgi:WD40 repeat protein